MCDINAEMLGVGRNRAIDRGWTSELRWSCGDAQSLPFPDMSFDAYTIAFGLRNVTHIDRALAEARRVLKPGGRFFCLEFSKVVVPALEKIYDAYSFSRCCRGWGSWSPATATLTFISPKASGAFPIKNADGSHDGGGLRAGGLPQPQRRHRRIALRLARFERTSCAAFAIPCAVFM